MSLSGVHVLLSYACTFECDHCFLYCSPRARGTFTLDQVERLLEQARELASVTSVYIEGGEPFLFHPLLVASLRRARAAGFETGVVTNCYWATCTEDAELWLEPLLAAGLADLSVSDDPLHHGDEAESPAKRAAGAAERLGMPLTSICIEKPLVETSATSAGEPVVGGSVLLKGRAADTLTDGLPTRPRKSFLTCPHEELRAPKRVHIDAYGHVQVCQGVSIGNVWRKTLQEIVEDYEPEAHPICGPLIRGGPRALADEHDARLAGEFVDECHYCFAVRRALMESFPAELAPAQVYGPEPGA